MIAVDKHKCVTIQILANVHSHPNILPFNNITKKAKLSEKDVVLMLEKPCTCHIFSIYYLLRRLTENSLKLLFEFEKWW